MPAAILQSAFPLIGLLALASIRASLREFIPLALHIARRANREL